MQAAAFISIRAVLVAFLISIRALRVLLDANLSAKLGVANPVRLGVQGVHPLVSGDCTLYGKGPQNDQQ